MENKNKCQRVFETFLGTYGFNLALIFLGELSRRHIDHLLGGRNHLWTWCSYSVRRVGSGRPNKVSPWFLSRTAEWYHLTPIPSLFLLWLQKKLMVCSHAPEFMTHCNWKLNVVGMVATWMEEAGILLCVWSDAPRVRSPRLYFQLSSERLAELSLWWEDHWKALLGPSENL